MAEKELRILMRDRDIRRGIFAVDATPPSRQSKGFNVSGIIEEGDNSSARRVLEITRFSPFVAPKETKLAVTSGNRGVTFSSSTETKGPDHSGCEYPTTSFNLCDLLCCSCIRNIGLTGLGSSRTQYSALPQDDTS